MIIIHAYIHTLTHTLTRTLTKHILVIFAPSMAKPDAARRSWPTPCLLLCLYTHTQTNRFPHIRHTHTQCEAKHWLKILSFVKTTTQLTFTNVFTTLLTYVNQVLLAPLDHPHRCCRLAAPCTRPRPRPRPLLSLLRLKRIPLIPSLRYPPRMLVKALNLNTIICTHAYSNKSLRSITKITRARIQANFYPIATFFYTRTCTHMHQ